MHRADDLQDRYEPGQIENTTAVTVTDDVPLSIDPVRASTVPLRPDPVDVQAMTAPEAGALADAVDRLGRQPGRSWILIVSSVDCLVEVVGQETTDRLVAVAVAEQAELAQRLLPRLDW